MSRWLVVFWLVRLCAEATCLHVSRNWIWCRLDYQLFRKLAILCDFHHPSVRLHRRLNCRCFRCPQSPVATWTRRSLLTLIVHKHDINLFWINIPIGLSQRTLFRNRSLRIRDHIMPTAINDINIFAIIHIECRVVIIDNGDSSLTAVWSCGQAVGCRSLRVHIDASYSRWKCIWIMDYFCIYLKKYNIIHKI